MDLKALTNEQLVTKLQTICRGSRRLLAQLLAYLAEVEERRLHLEAACSSLFVYCIRHLGMSEGEASRRIAAARLARRFPVLLDAVAQGMITLTSIVLLRHLFTEDNVEELVREASGKSKLDVLRLVATRAPQPDAPSKIRALPRAHVTPLSPRTHKVQFTASEELRAKLERAADLMRHSNPSGDLAVIVDRALDHLIADLEKRRLGKRTNGKFRARVSAKPTKGVPLSVRAEVFERDGAQCTFVAADGQRCDAHTLLELDHIVPRALGGSNDAANLRVRCRAHNRYYAEQVFGREYVEARIASKEGSQASATSGREEGRMALALEESDAPSPDAKARSTRTAMDGAP